MLNDNSGIVKAVLSILLFPTFFQEAFIDFAWGSGDQFWVMSGKRLFLLLPVLAIILGCWLSIASLLTVLVRQNRREFVTDLLITWFDLGKSIASFWGGIFRFAFNLIMAFLALVKITVLGILSVIQDIVFMPFRLIGNVGRGIVNSSVPWIAVFLTLFWCLIEAVIFTYVTAPLVVDTFSNITGEQLSENFVRLPLFVFLFFIVLGSYAVLSTLVDVVKSRRVSAILGIIVIEIVVLFVEVVFLYREFVDSLVPWFAQYSENFDLGIFWTLAISGFAWFGIRSLSWFLFAANGTPTILAVIQGKGLALSQHDAPAKRRSFYISSEFMNKIKEETAWVQAKGEELVASFILPPLQVVAAAINFCTLLISNGHLFELPLKNIAAITKTNSTAKIVTNKFEPELEPYKEAPKNIGEFQNV
jgi:hypothetical protein